MIDPIGVTLMDPNSEEVRNALAGTEPSTDSETGSAEDTTTTAEDDNESRVPTFTGLSTAADIKEEDFVVPDNKEKEEPTLADIQSFAKELFDNDILSISEDDLKNIDSAKLKEAIQESIEAKSEDLQKQYISNFSGSKKTFLEIEGDFPDEAMAMNIARDLDLVSKVTDSDIEGDDELAKYIVAGTLRQRGFDEKEIKDEIQSYEDLEKLSDKAKDFRIKFKENLDRTVTAQSQKTAAVRQERENAQKAYYEGLMNKVDTSEEIFPGIEMTTRMKNTLKTKMTEVAYRDKASGREYTEVGHKQLTHPEEFTVAIEMLNLMGLLNFDKNGEYKPDLSKISKITEKGVKGSVDKLITEDQKRGAFAEKDDTQAATKSNWADLKDYYKIK